MVMGERQIDGLIESDQLRILPVASRAQEQKYDGGGEGPKVPGAN
jgi:hypothetical protein